MNLERFNFISNLMILTLFFFGSLVWADSNGIWHDAKDVRGGTFGSDEQDNTSSFSFINPVFFSGVLTANNNAIFNGILTANNNAVFNGNVGIGIANPGAKLEVQNSLPATTSADAGRILSIRNSNLPLGNGETRFLDFGSLDSSTAFIRPVGRKLAIIGDVNTNRTTVGIGTTTPNTNLDVRGYITADADPNYDVWIQGRSTGGLAGGNSRNLALLGVKGTDRLYVNYGNEYAGGTVLGTPVCIGGTCQSNWVGVSQTCPAGYFVKGFDSTGGIICGVDQKTTGGGSTGGGTTMVWCDGTQSWIPSGSTCGGTR